MHTRPPLPERRPSGRAGSPSLFTAQGRLPGRTRGFSCRGFTIAEILTALLVVGVALIGIAALYSQSVRTHQDSDPRTSAAELAQAMAERIRTNAAGRAGYATTIGVSCDPSLGTPTAEAAAVQETACWQEEIANALPNGQGTITRDRTTTPPSYVIAVNWSAPGSGAASYVTRVHPDS